MDKPILEMTLAEMCIELLLLEKQFTEADYIALENNLTLRAYVLGWTGDPLQQPAESVLASARQVLQEKETR